MMATSPATHQGTGTAEPPFELRIDASFHQIRSPFSQGGGLFLAGGPAGERGILMVKLLTER
jgi:hypothetical protein